MNILSYRTLGVGIFVKMEERFLFLNGVKDVHQSMLDANPGLDKMYAVGDGNIEVYYIRNAKADICSFTDAPKHLEF